MSKTVGDFLNDLHAAVGNDGMLTALQMLRDIDPYKIEDEVGIGEGKGLPHPMPMAFADAWGEMFDLLLREANKWIIERASR